MDYDRDDRELEYDEELEKELKALIRKAYKDGCKTIEQNIRDYIDMCIAFGLPFLSAVNYSWEDNNSNNATEESIDSESLIHKAFKDGYIACARNIREHIDMMSNYDESPVNQHELE